MTGAAVAMSGGVDSSVAAFLLKKQGYQVNGFMFTTCGAMREQDRAGQRKDIEDARLVAESLKIPFSLLDVSGQFRSSVIEYFADRYLAGETPNPCVICNQTIKFPTALSFADSCGAQKIATGHYARVEKDAGTGRFLIKKARDMHSGGADVPKDQSYMLYPLSQEVLSRLLLPIGEYGKEEIREIARENRLVNFRKADSQDICFVPDGDYASFLHTVRSFTDLPGDFKDLAGNVLGQHRGIVHYTVGQRRGLGISAAEPLYVLRKDPEQNAVILGRNQELFSDRVKIRETHFIPFDSLTKPVAVEAKIRYSQNAARALLHPTGKNTALLEFEEPQRAPTPGQSAVFYDGDILIGGGIIEF